VFFSLLMFFNNLLVIDCTCTIAIIRNKSRKIVCRGSREERLHEKTRKARDVSILTNQIDSEHKL